MVCVMGMVGDIFVRLGLNVQDFQKGLKKAEASMKDVGEGFQKTGESMARAISLPLAGIGALAVKGAIDVQKSQGNIQAQLGITKDEAEKLQGVVNNLFSEGLGGDITEVQNSVTTVIRNLHSLEGASNDTVEKVARNTMNLAKTFDSDAGEITKTINGMQESFDGLSVEESFDLITNGFQNGLDYSGEFLDSVNEYSGQFSNLGFSVGEMFTLFQKGAESGAFQLDKVGDVMKEFNIRLSDGTWEDYADKLSSGTQQMYKDFKKTGKGGKELFQAVVGEINNMDNEQDQYMLGQALMGTQFEDLGKKGVNALAYVTDEMAKAKGSTDAMNEALNKDIGTVMIGAFREITVALEPIGTEIGKLAEEYLPPLIKKIEGLANWFTGLSDKSQGLVLALAGIGIVFPFILIGIGAVINSFGAIFGAMSGTIAIAGKVGGAFKKLKGALNLTKLVGLVTSPVGLIILAIAGLIAVGYLIWKNWDTIKAKAIEIWGAISSFFSETWSKISEGVSTFLTNVGNWFSEKWESIKTKTAEVFNSIVDFLVEWGLKLFSMTPIGMFVNLIIRNWDLIRDTTVIVFEMIVGIIRAIFLKIVEVVKPLVTAYLNMVKKSWTAVFNVTKKIFTSVKNFFVSLWKSLLSFVKPILTGIANFVSKSWNKVSSVTRVIFAIVKSTVYSVFNSVRNKISDVASSVYSSVKSKFGKMKNAMMEPINKAKDGISKAIGKIKSLFSGLRLKIPMPTVPKISVTKGYKTFLGQEIPYPKFKVGWNAKGNIFTGATLLGGGQGVGEAGAEAVIPLERKRYFKPYVAEMSRMLADMQGDEPSGNNVQNTFNISQLVVREEADIERIADELERKQRKEKRAKGSLVFS
jgi:phage-related minor tail protein